MNDTEKSKSFASKARDLLWPIYGIEHKIWLPMATMVGLILFNYTVARNMKDGLVITATGSSEVLTFLRRVAPRLRKPGVRLPSGPTSIPTEQRGLMTLCKQVPRP